MARDPDTAEAKVARLVFGKPGRMMAGIYIATLDDERAKGFTNNDFWEWAKKTGRQWATGNNFQDFRRFVELGMCTEAPPSFGAPILFARVDHPMWDVFCLLDVVLQERDPEHPRKFFRLSQESTQAIVSDLEAIRDLTAKPDPEAARRASLKAEGLAIIQKLRAVRASAE